jgi:hypothetical protein
MSTDLPEVGSKRKGFTNVKSLSKKRFVWPENLHRSFIGSIFDIGLNNSSTKVIYDAIIAKHNNVTPAEVATFLQNIRAYRLRGRMRNCETESSIGTDTDTRNTQPIQHNTNNIAKLSSQNVLLTESIDKQAHVIERLQWSLMKQSQLRDHILNKLEMIKERGGYSMDNSSDEDAQNNNCNINGASTSTNVLSVTPLLTTTQSSMSQKQQHPQSLLQNQSEWDILFEMRSHMDLHRQLLNRRNETLLVNGIAPSSSTNTNNTLLDTSTTTVTEPLLSGKNSNISLKALNGYKVSDLISSNSSLYKYDKNASLYGINDNLSNTSKSNHHQSSAINEYNNTKSSSNFYRMNSLQSELSENLEDEINKSKEQINNIIPEGENTYDWNDNDDDMLFDFLA